MPRCPECNSSDLVDRIGLYEYECETCGPFDINESEDDDDNEVD